MTDEASKLLRREPTQEMIDAGYGRSDLLHNPVVINARAWVAHQWRAMFDAAPVAALPAAAPRMIQTPAGLAQPWQVGEETDEEHAAAVAAVAAAQAAPLPGPPREPSVAESHQRIVSGKGTLADYVHVLGDPTVGVSSSVAGKTTDQGASVIAPKPTDAEAQGQSTMQASNVTGNSAMSEQNAAAKSFSRAGDDAAEHSIVPEVIPTRSMREFARRVQARTAKVTAERTRSDQLFAERLNVLATRCAAYPMADAGIGRTLMIECQQALREAAYFIAGARTEGTRQHAGSSTVVGVDAGDAAAINRKDAP